METYNLAKTIKTIQNLPQTLLTTREIKNVLGIVSTATLHRLVKDLVENDILGKLERGKYFVNDSRINDFVKANIFYSPSYVSFETALNHHGILSQFPYETTSATPKKSITKQINQKIYSYSQIKKSLFWGYIKQDNYLIAEPEKALLDQIYLHAKGVKGLSIDEYDLERINFHTITRYARLFPKSKSFFKALNLLEVHKPKKGVK